MRHPYLAFDQVGFDVAEAVPERGTPGAAATWEGAVSVTIRLVGGPGDGRSFTLPDEHPPQRWLVALPRPLPEFLAAPAWPPTPTPIPSAEYEPLRENGWPRRADDGAYLYGHRVAPVPPEVQRANEFARREAQAAEEKRAAELDETWREIRKERPYFPEDWRDL